jgi:hypothetical protein
MMMAKMFLYRAYIFGKDGHISRAVEILCPDDATAKEYATWLIDGHDIELWQFDRLIAILKHQNTE